MFHPTRSATVARSATVVLLACACALASATPAAAAAATPLPKESLVVFEGQLRGHRVHAVTLRTRVHTLHVTLTDGRKVLVALPSSQQQRLLGDVRADGVPVNVVKAKAPSHKRRDIVIGAAIVVIVLAVAGLLLFMRRRRTREEE